jgi:hypothetical protein
MKRQVKGALLAAGIALAISATTALPAAAAASGSETFSGTIVTSGVSGTRTVITSVIIAKGVFSGVGQIVEIPSLPTDPPNVSRDDLVFPEGTMHLVSTTTSFSVSLNPHSCVATAAIQQNGQIDGGTGQFANATGTGTGTVTGPAVLARNPDGSCSFEHVPLHEVDMITSTGTLSF